MTVLCLFAGLFFGLNSFYQDHAIIRWEGIVFVVLMVGYLVLLVVSAKKHPDEVPQEVIKDMPVWRSLLFIVIGAVGIAIGGEAVVFGAKGLALAGATSAGVDPDLAETLVGLTLVAVGTSLPELASAIVSARKGESEFVIGNIVGSNLFNTLAVVGLAGTITPFSNFSPYILSRDLPLMFGLSLSIAIFGLNFRNVRKDGLISRWKGAIWLLVLLAYLALMIFQEVK